MRHDNCNFCKLANGEIPTATLYEDEDFRVILDASPAAKGHALTENIATFLITCMNKAFSNFAWGSSYDTKLLQNVMLSLPVKTKYIPDFNLMSEIIWGGSI